MKILLAWLAASLLAAETPSAIAIHNARIVTVAGPVIDKGTVLIRDGIIAGVGENLTPPPDAWVIEAQGLTVYPGLIDALSTWGIPPPAPAVTVTTATSGRTTTSASSRRSSTAAAEPVVHGPAERPSTNSWVRAADLVSVDDPRILSGRNAGFTAAVTFPTTGIFGGQGALINLSGDKRRTVMGTPLGQYCSLATAGFSTYPGSLMGVIAYIRQVYLDAAHYRIERAAYEKDRTAPRPDYDRAVEGVLESPRVLLPAGSGVQLERMARFAAELKLNAVLYGGHESYAAAPALRQFGYPVLVSLRWPERARDADPELHDTLRTLILREQAPGSAAALAKAGVKYAFYTDGINARDVHRAVKRAVDAGLSPADAVRALTLSAAEIYGVADRLGSVEKGKIANLVVTSGELFQERTQVKFIFIDGVKYEPMAEPPATERTTGTAAAGGESPSPDNPPMWGGTQPVLGPNKATWTSPADLEVRRTLGDKQ
jgi:imidazolonepropionase-like amidohydrolase